jgi:hypothetical protein
MISSLSQNPAGLSSAGLRSSFSEPREKPTVFNAWVTIDVPERCIPNTAIFIYLVFQRLSIID